MTDLAALLPSWELHLRAERKSPQTVKTYGDGVRRFLAWCTETGTAPTLDRPTVVAFVADLLDAGAAGSTWGTYEPTTSGTLRAAHPPLPGVRPPARRVRPRQWSRPGLDARLAQGHRR